LAGSPSWRWWSSARNNDLNSVAVTFATDAWVVGEYGTRHLLTGFTEYRWRLSR
jgi:hypothetical protein